LIEKGFKVKNKDFIIEQIKNGATIAQYKEYADDKDVVLESVNRDGLSLFYVSDRLKDDIDVVSLALKDNAEAVLYASVNLQNNINVLRDVREYYIFNYSLDRNKEIDFKFIGVNKIRTFMQDKMSALSKLEEEEKMLSSMDNIDINNNKKVTKLKF
jgi:hypothetical protein